MLKRITTKESDIVNPLMAKVRASIQKSRKQKDSICIRRLNSLLADGPNLTADEKKI
jgi:outer membrane protein